MSKFHSNTERLLDYWRERKVDQLGPARASINPADLTGLLPQTFILGRVAPGEYLFRLIGGLPADLHRRDLRGVDFLTLWIAQDRPRLCAAMDAASRSAEPVVVVAGARTADGAQARLEILLTPLRAEQYPLDRWLGLYQPLSPLVQLRGKALGELELIRFGAADQEQRFPRLRLAAVDGQRIATRKEAPQPDDSKPAA